MAFALLFDITYLEQGSHHVGRTSEQTAERSKDRSKVSHQQPGRPVSRPASHWWTGSSSPNPQDAG